MSGASLVQELLDGPLWCVVLGEGGLCAAEMPDGTFLVLFTSPALAAQFIRAERVGRSEKASTGLYSGDCAHFLSRAQSAAADGIRGTLVDLQPDGQVREILRFCFRATGPGVGARYLGSGNQALH